MKSFQSALSIKTIYFLQSHNIQSRNRHSTILLPAWATYWANFFRCSHPSNMLIFPHLTNHDIQDLFLLYLCIDCLYLSNAVKVCRPWWSQCLPKSAIEQVIIGYVHEQVRLYILSKWWLNSIPKDNRFKSLMLNVSTVQSWLTNIYL